MSEVDVLHARIAGIAKTTSTVKITEESFGPDGNLPDEMLSQIKNETAAELLDTRMALMTSSTATLKAKIARPIVVAEGDSWFKLPFRLDVIDALTKFHKSDYAIESEAKAGDTIENMVLGTDPGGQDDDGSTGLDALIARVTLVQPKVVLFSGGGNDVCGTELVGYLNHSKSGQPLLRAPVLQYNLDYFRGILQQMIDRVVAASPQSRILMHGYDYAIPSGKSAFKVLFWKVGPWLKPALQFKQIDDASGRQLIRQIVDEFNGMLGQLEVANPNHFKHIDVRGSALSDNDWHDELHLKDKAVIRVADTIHAEIMNYLP